MVLAFAQNEIDTGARQEALAGLHEKALAPETLLDQMVELTRGEPADGCQIVVAQNIGAPTVRNHGAQCRNETQDAARPKRQLTPWRFIQPTTAEVENGQRIGQRDGSARKTGHRQPGVECAPAGEPPGKCDLDAEHADFITVYSF